MPGSESANTTSSALRVLLVEDNAVNQKVVLRQLEQLGYNADLAANGLEALEALSKIEYDVVLMDCQMPEMDGYEATREIRRREGRSRRTTIIAMTDNAARSNRDLCIRAGMDDYLNKPARQEDLAAMLAHWTEAARGISAKADRAGDECDLTRVIDQGALDGLRSLTSATRPNFLMELIDLFIEDSPAKIARMREALARADAVALASAAHALKSSSANLGARRMHALCELIEERSSQSSLRGAATLLAALEEEFARVRRALEVEKKK